MGSRKKQPPSGDKKTGRKRNFDPWDTFTTLAKTGISLPLLFTPQIADLSGELTRIITGRSAIKPRKNDLRFRDKEWDENPIYKASMQAYLAWCESIESTIGDSSLDEYSKSEANNALNLLTNYLSPSHSAVNFKVMSRAYKTRGASLVHGLRRMTDDIAQNSAQAKTSKRKLKVGKSLATTKGSVVYRDEFLELIQYQPVTGKVRKVPLLMLPSPINRYYLYDLGKQNSLVRYLLDHGNQVFTVSWFNPGHEQKHWNLESYIEALLNAFNVVAAIKKTKTLNLFGLSAGGIMAAIAASICAQKNLFPDINSLTFATTGFDTQTESQIGSILNKQVIMAAKTLARIRGTMDGKELAQLFVWMRPNNLMWNAWVCNYFAGEDMPGDDIMHWNYDTARIPAELHCNFLDMYGSNPLVKPKGLEFCHTQVDLSEITCDSYLIAGSSDHISPWESCYRSSRLLGGTREFVLVNRGHSRTLVCPEGSDDTRFYTNSEPLENPEDWLSEAVQHDSSWWPHWIKWLNRHAGTQVKAPSTLGSKDHPPICSAPGEYVHS